ncbi:PepSY-like domain-containing protein [Mucilaginibacter sp. HMF5004]|uniref:PepSY-like domain-containing protein n=1 Tax=Mucilaginibacter rivuli TaxID=2857527 RepID=UPI001C5D115A|nr:hypothetical protein [Mucilaginibacter rivuli]MBW4888228.1 PepSY-like domain-containing protein [Mucilaginibacter rivuli]
MKKSLLITGLLALSTSGYLFAQDVKASAVPAAVKAEFAKRYPAVTKVGWEKEKGNYEANWGGKSGEDNAAMFTPAGVFVEYVHIIPISELPKTVVPYVKEHYKTAVKEAGKGTDAEGKPFYEAEIKGAKDVVFDINGKFIKID